MAAKYEGIKSPCNLNLEATAHGLDEEVKLSCNHGDSRETGHHRQCPESMSEYFANFEYGVVDV